MIQNDNVVCDKAHLFFAAGGTVEEQAADTESPEWHASSPG